MAENPKFGNENLGGSEIPFGSSTNTSPKTNNYDPSATRRGTLPLGAIPANDLNFVDDTYNQFDIMFPFTPQITMEHTANYNALHPTHSNYPFPAYQNSQVNALTIVGEFFVETAEDAKYWIAATHYLRSVTKMAYGATSNQGSPPPIVKLNGYGDYVFNDVPVTVTYFTVDLPSDVDYIQTDVGPNGTWVPVKSNINIQVQPTYSRKNITKFSLDTFISGGYIASGKGFI